MALTSFPDGSYLELIAIQRRADPAAVAAHEWHVAMESNGGPCAWAVRPRISVFRDCNGCALRQFPSRMLKETHALRPDKVRLDWETAQVGSGNGTFFPFLIHDFTPREDRAFPSGKPTTATFSGISKVVIGVKDLDSGGCAIPARLWTSGARAPRRMPISAPRWPGSGAPRSYWQHRSLRIVAGRSCPALRRRPLRICARARQEGRLLN